AARDRRESAERELAALAGELSGAGWSGADLDLAAIGTALAKDEAAVAFRRFMRWRLVRDGDADEPEMRFEGRMSLCAFVVRPPEPESSRVSASLALLDLGASDPIATAATIWRHAVTGDRPRGAPLAPDPAAARGQALRRLVFDPLLPALGDVRRVVVVPDDVLHLVPLDALPLDGAEGCVGERWRLEMRTTLSELLAAPRPTDATALVALGGASFNHAPLALSADEPPAADEPRLTLVAGVLRGGAWERGFAPLTHSAEEARGIGALYEELFAGERAAVVVEKRKASREALDELAPDARFLHVASHGWFAPESVTSWDDPEALDPRAGAPGRMSVADRVRGLSPMVLCGLALAGANLPADERGRLPGLVTAEELSSWDLSRCELAVLSACDTNVGLRRAGQGVAGLQKALRMAGARSVVTSVWKVPDEATKQLMLDFYRRLWVEKKPKLQALWEAKLRLRDARDEYGEPLYTARDWAGWVLTGEPD
ncbi:MAG TPA: CHAT domain-containing protein, partial [Planctomycetota bacterium]|nr:CHAT domain-containing protein [Planctomycetota bacterium]